MRKLSVCNTLLHGSPLMGKTKKLSMTESPKSVMIRRASGWWGNSNSRVGWRITQEIRACGFMASRDQVCPHFIEFEGGNLAYSITPGKSVICSYIIQRLIEKPGLTTCYYYCDSRSSGNVCQQILATIAIQLLRQHHEISTLVANEFVYRGVDCTMTQLRNLVPQLLQTVASTRIVIDGLDECSKEDQKVILKELRTICIGPALQCKVLFSSRKEAHIRQKLLKQPYIALDSRQEVNQDIQSYLKYKVSKLATSDQDLLKRIEKTLMEKANGKQVQFHRRNSDTNFIRYVFMGSASLRRTQILLQ